MRIFGFSHIGEHEVLRYNSETDYQDSNYPYDCWPRTMLEQAV